MDEFCQVHSTQNNVCTYMHNNHIYERQANSGFNKCDLKCLINIKIGDLAKYGHLSSAISKVTLYYISECSDHISLCLAQFPYFGKKGHQSKSFSIIQLCIDVYVQIICNNCHSLLYSSVQVCTYRLYVILVILYYYSYVCIDVYVQIICNIWPHCID